MESRKYDKRIEVFANVSQSDGFGGSIVSQQSLGKSWCRIKTPSASRLTELGKTELSTQLIFQLRYRKDLPYTVNHIIRYRDTDYTISSIINKGFHDTEIEIIANGK